MGWGRRRRRTSVSHPRGQYNNPMWESKQHAKQKPPHFFVSSCRFQPTSSKVSACLIQYVRTDASANPSKHLEKQPLSSFDVLFFGVKEEVWWVMHIKFSLHHVLPLRFLKLHIFLWKKRSPTNSEEMTKPAKSAWKTSLTIFPFLGRMKNHGQKVSSSPILKQRTKRFCT